MNFRNYGDLAAALVNWQDDLPSDIDLVCGVPRSGLMAATMFALSRNLPLTDIEGLLAGRILGGGRRMASIVEGKGDLLSKRRKILVLDDSVLGGRAMRDTRERLTALADHHELLFAAVYVSRDGRELVDHHYEVVERPRFFEWNLFHSKALDKACLDIDGVLCRDPTKQENDDGANYVNFIRTVSPRYVPTVEVGHLVTSRLEKYRIETEAWLNRANIKYGRLWMLDLPSAAERRGTNKSAEFKASVYRGTDAIVFIESEESQARFIANATQRFVICSETMALVGPAGLQTAVARSRNVVRSELRAWAVRIKRKMLARLRGGDDRIKV